MRRKAEVAVRVGCWFRKSTDTGVRRRNGANALDIPAPERSSSVNVTRKCLETIKNPRGQVTVMYLDPGGIFVVSLWGLDDLTWSEKREFLSRGSRKTRENRKLPTNIYRNS